MTAQVQPPQSRNAEAPPSKPLIASIVFVHSISFAGGINSASSAPGLAAVERLGSGIDIRPATMTPNGPRELVSGQPWDGFLLTKEFTERSGAKPVTVRRTQFVPRENVKEVALSSE